MVNHRGESPAAQLTFAAGRPGGSRCGASATATILDDFRKQEAAGTLDGVIGKIGSGGY